MAQNKWFRAAKLAKRGAFKKILRDIGQKMQRFIVEHVVYFVGWALCDLCNLAAQVVYFLGWVLCDLCALAAFVLVFCAMCTMISVTLQHVL